MIGGDFNVPIMYQDLANSSMGPLNMPFGGMVGAGMPIGGYNTSYLGGVQMQQQPDRDKLVIKNKKENEDKNTFKKALGVLALEVGLGCIPIFRKGIKKAGGVIPYLKNMWKGNNTSFMTKVKNRFSSIGKSVKKGAYNITVRPAKAIGRGFKKLGSGIKNIFKK